MTERYEQLNDKKLRELQKIEEIGILSFQKKYEEIITKKSPLQSRKVYELLPIKYWNREICEAINACSFDIPLCLRGEESVVEITDKIKNIFEPLNNMTGFQVKNIYACKLPPGVYFVRFSGIVFLSISEQEDDYQEYAKHCLESIKEGLSLIHDFEGKKDALMKDTNSIEKYEDAKSNLELLTQICALTSHFAMDTRPQNGADNYLWNELLQNANDHIPACSNNRVMNISLNDTYLELSYPDAGFSIRDFLAISTSGNSGSKLSDDIRTGRKGTGFKSVYNLFNKVMITSHEVECKLEDKPVRFIIDPRDASQITFEMEENARWNNEEKYYYPIPLFSKAKEKVNGTRIRLYFEKSNKKTILSRIFGKEDIGKEELLNGFIAERKYLFLKNIDKFSFCVQMDDSECEFEFDKIEHLKQTYYCFEEYINFENEEESIKGNNPYWCKEENRNKFKNNSVIQIYFPKEPDEGVKNIYCTLPIEAVRLETPFYINISLLELDDTRNDLAAQKNDAWSLEKYNSGILEHALWKNGSAFSKIYKKLNDIVGMENSYKYFPYTYIDKKWYLKTWMPVGWECLNKISFIRAVKTNENGIYNESLCSIMDLAGCKDADDVESDKVVFLPSYMYDWFNMNAGLTEYKSDISFVYYEEQDHNPKKVWDLRSEDRKEGMLRYKRECDGQVGQVLLDIRDYILKKSIAENENFSKLLKNILKSEREFSFNAKDYLVFFAFLQYKIGNLQYHCIGNRELNKDKSLEITGYTDIQVLVTMLKTALLDNGVSLSSQQKMAIKACFEDKLIQSPYIKYVYSWKTTEWEETTELCLAKEVIAKLEDGNKEQLLEDTKEVLKNDKDFEEGIRAWIDEGCGLYARATQGNVEILSSLSYCSSKKNIKANNVFANEETGINLNKYLKNLDEEITTRAFWESAEIEFLKQVIEAYKINEWRGGAEEYIKEAKDDEKISLIAKSLFKEILSADQVREQRIGPCDFELWKDKIKMIFDEINLEDFVDKKRTPLFEVSQKSISPLSRISKDKFEQRVSYEEQQKSIGTMKLRDFVVGSETHKSRVYVYDYSSRKSLYCWANLKETGEKVVILFDEKVLDKMLKDEFDCNEFSKSHSYEGMDCCEFDMLVGWIYPKWSKEIETAVDAEAAKIAHEWKKNWDKKKLLDELVFRTDISYEMKSDDMEQGQGDTRWIHIKGYGEKTYEEKKCPICRGILLAEKSLLKIGYFTYRVEGKNINLPMVMCENCLKSFSHANSVTIFEECEEIGNVKDKLQLNEFSHKEIEVTFAMYAGEEKVVNVKVSFINRWLWWKLIESIVIDA